MGDEGEEDDYADAPTEPAPVRIFVFDDPSTLATEGANPVPPAPPSSVALARSAEAREGEWDGATWNSDQLDAAKPLAPQDTFPVEVLEGAGLLASVDLGDEVKSALNAFREANLARARAAEKEGKYWDERTAREAAAVPPVSPASPSPSPSPLDTAMAQVGARAPLGVAVLGTGAAALLGGGYVHWVFPVLVLALGAGWVAYAHFNQD